MLDIWCVVIGVVVALWSAALIAFPDRFNPQVGPKKRRFHAYHWGAYDGSKPDEAMEEDDGVEVCEPSRKPGNVTGSRTYAYGRGISFRS